MSGVQLSEHEQLQEAQTLGDILVWYAAPSTCIQVARPPPLVVDIYVDTDFAGCKETRRSTSGGAVMAGGCLAKHWSNTQTTISLRSGKPELHGIAQGMAHSLGIPALMADMGWKRPITVRSDATAAIGIARRKRPQKDPSSGRDGSMDTR